MEQLGTCRTYGHVGRHPGGGTCIDWKPVPAPAEPVTTLGEILNDPRNREESTKIAREIADAARAEIAKRSPAEPAITPCSACANIVDFCYGPKHCKCSCHAAKPVLKEGCLERQGENSKLTMEKLAEVFPAEPAEYTCPRCGSNVSTHICMGEPATENAGKVQATGTHWCLTCGITALGCGHELANRQDDSASAEPVDGETKPLTEWDFDIPAVELERNSRMYVEKLLYESNEKLNQALAKQEELEATVERLTMRERAGGRDAAKEVGVREVAATAYQICGALEAPARILDYFSAVASGEAAENPLPFTPERSCGETAWAKSKELHEAWQAWLEQHGVPISMEFVRLANAVGEFTEPVRALPSPPTAESTKEKI